MMYRVGIHGERWLGGHASRIRVNRKAGETMLRKSCFYAVAVLLPFLLSCSAPTSVEVYFSPDGGAAEAITGQIERSKESIDVAMYAFTSRELAWTLVNAHKRGVKVKVLLDGDFAKNKYSKGTFLDRQGIDVRLDMTHLNESGESSGHMHHKFAVIDHRVVVAGSYNWTASAERRNEETLLIFPDERELARAFEEEFKKLWSRSRPFDPSLVGEEPVAEIPVIPATDLAALRQNAGKMAKVQGKVHDVYHSERSDTYFLHFGPGKGSFTGVIFRSTAKLFLDQGINPKGYEGRTVELIGEVIDHPKYGLEIIINDPSQIETLEEE